LGARRSQGGFDGGQRLPRRGEALLRDLRADGHGRVQLGKFLLRRPLLCLGARSALLTRVINQD